ncbi:MAG: phosphate/phosphite/phosphonate ABC transporter substrate-binding protein [Thermostichus sp. DG02_4_bins_136]
MILNLRSSVQALLLGSVLGLSSLLVGSLAQAEEDCPRPPQMDRRFCDRDGDLVADLPEDESEWVDPPVLLLSYTSSEDPAVYKETWAEFTEHLESVIGRPVQFVPVDSHAASYEAMRAGRLHVMATCTGCTPFAVNLSGFVPFAMSAESEDSFGYEMEFIVPVNSDIQTLEDIRGRQVAFASPTSNSGYIAPVALLKSETGMIEGEDYTSVFSGDHQNSILGIQNEDYEVAPIANSVMFRMCRAGQADCSLIRSIYKSGTFPSGPFGHAHNLHPDLVEKIKEAFFSFDWEGTKLQEAFERNVFIPVTYKEHWQVIRQIQEAQGTEYSL